ncbi:MAG: hypothetical protein ABIH46_05320 [Chloroflexota bacterium]
MATLRILTAEGCAPCDEVKQMIKSKRFILETGKHDKAIEIEVIDVTTEEGFPYIAQYNLNGVPAAYLDEERCTINYEDDDSGRRRAVVSCGVSQEEPTKPA